MFWRTWAGMLLLGGLLSSVAAGESRQGPRTADRSAIVLEIGEAPERAIRGLSERAPGDRRVEAALDRIVTLRCHEALLGEVAREIERQLGIPVRLLNESWAGEERDPNLKVSIEADGVPLASAIEALAGSETLSLFADKGKLVIAHSTRGNELRTTRIYHVPRLQQLGMPRVSKLIRAWTSGPWDENEPGTGTITSYGDALVVRQNLRNHREIEAFLNLLNQASRKLKPRETVSNQNVGPSEGPAFLAETPNWSVVSTEPLKQPGIELIVSDVLAEEIRGLGELTPGDRKVETALQRIVTLRCRDVSLEDLAHEIERKLEIPVRFATSPHPDGVVDRKQRVSIEAYGVPLQHAINYVGDDPVATDVTGGKLLFVPAGGCGFYGPSRFYSVARFQSVGLNRLAELIIQETSGPWDEDEPGTGTLRSLGDTFVIRQTHNVHREIDQLLNLLERLDIQPLPGEQVWTNAAAVIATEKSAFGLRIGTGLLPSRPRSDVAPSLGDLAFRSSDRDEMQSDDSVHQDQAATVPPKRSLRLDVSPLPPGAMRGAGRLTSEEVKLETALRRIVTLRCEDLPLEELAREIERVFDVPVRLQLGPPPSAGVDPRRRVSIEVYGVPLGRALSLGPSVRWTTERGELRFVPPDGEGEEPRRTRIYQVADFRALGLDEVSELIKEETSGPWHEDEPGTGTLEVIGETLVVHQTPRNHSEIEDLLDLLDRLDTKPVPKGQEVVRPRTWEWGGLGGGFY